MPGPGFFLAGEEERREVEEVLQTGYLSRYGRDDDPLFRKKVIRLEEELSRAVETRYSIAVSSGTGALMAALVAMGVGPGVEVLVPGYTFVASIAAILRVGGRPVLTEIDNSFTMDPEDAERKITGRTRVIMPVHMLGYPCALERLGALARRHGLFLLEDGCQALGGSYRGRRLGSVGDMGAFSLNIYKTLTSGEGGFVVTDDRRLYERAYGFHDQGFAPLRSTRSTGDWTLVGINLKMNELTAAYILGQLSKLDTIMSLLSEKKQRLVEAIRAGGMRGMELARLNDPGECHEVLTVVFPDAGTARRAAEALGTITLAESGWHVYGNMAQVLAWEEPDGQRPFRPGMLPRTDELLARAVNLSVGVVNPGLGSEFGITIRSSDAEIEKQAAEFLRLVGPLLG